MRAAIERFMDKVRKDTATGCWLWQAHTTPAGYGGFTPDSYRPSVVAHRWAYEHFVGPIPAGRYVLHRCDVRRCVNPEHLFVGTLQDNHADMVQKGRQARGSRHGGSKLSEEQVRAIRAATGPQKAIAAEFGVCQATVSQIRRRARWAHLD